MDKNLEQKIRAYIKSISNLKNKTHKEMKKTTKVKSSLVQKIICCIVTIVGIILIINSFGKSGIRKVSPSLIYETVELGKSWKVDVDHIFTGDVESYVGGDAYNFMISSPLKSGEFVGYKIDVATFESIKTIKLVGGLILTCFSLIFLFNDKTIEYKDECP